MAAVLEEPISPELVLVSPPEVARRARELLQAPVEAAFVAGERVPSRLGPVVFAAAALANCVLPTALLLLAR